MLKSIHDSEVTHASEKLEEKRFTWAMYLIGSSDHLWQKPFVYSSTSTEAFFLMQLKSDPELIIAKTDCVRPHLFIVILIMPWSRDFLSWMRLLQSFFSQLLPLPWRNGIWTRKSRSSSRLTWTICLISIIFDWILSRNGKSILLYMYAWTTI